MSFEDFENLFTLLCAIVGLLTCLFKYIEHPKRGYLYLVISFLGHFFSDYYWAVYVLIMHSSPNVSGFLAYLGWNIAYFFLILAVFHFREEKERYFHPLMLWPLLTNIPLFILYIQFGGIFNNLWQVGTTTIVMILCMREILYYCHHKKAGAHFPRLPFFVLLFTIFGYGMWTASCFDWKTETSNPYLYFTVLAYSSTLFFAWAAGKDYEDEGLIIIDKNETELRFQSLLQTLTSFIIFGICIGGYFIVVRMKNSIPDIEEIDKTTNSIVTILFITSVLLILLVIIMLHVIATRYRIARKKRQNMDAGKLSTINFIITVLITLILMGGAVIYNTMLLYDTSVIGVYENGEDKVKMFSTNLENYLAETESTLRVTADTVDLMVKNGASTQNICQFLVEQTNKQIEQFDENFTDLYAYIDGEYLDGLGWEPPEGYDPVSRDWYKTAVQAKGKLVIVSPYLDAHTGYIVITIAKCISDGMNAENLQIHNVVALDVIVKHVLEVTEQISILGKGYGMVVNGDGFIVAHKDEAFNGKNLTDFYDSELLNRIVSSQNTAFHFVMNNEKCTLFVHPIMKQWYAVVVVNDTELFEEVHSQMVINIVILLIAFLLISFFYYLGYKNERNYGMKVEEMNVQVVSALATAIDAKDAYTNGHSARVAEYSKMIANKMGYSESKQDEIFMMGLLHDIGKIGVLDKIINKPGELTDEEFELIKNHPVIGSNILETIRERPRLAMGARWHHERFDGSGYPDGIAGDKIPEEARIIAVADAYDAMTSIRSYRDVMPQKKVREEIIKGMGTQFDPQFAKVMIQLIDEDTDYYMCGK